MIQNAESEAFKLRASAQILSDFKAFFLIFLIENFFWFKKCPERSRQTERICAG